MFLPKCCGINLTLGAVAFGATLILVVKVLQYLYQRRSAASARDRAFFLHSFSHLDFVQGRYNIAYEKILMSLKIQRKLQGGNHSTTLPSLSLIVDIFFYQGEYKQAEEMMRQSLNSNTKAFGANHPNALFCPINWQRGSTPGERIRRWMRRADGH